LGGNSQEYNLDDVRDSDRIVLQMQMEDKLDTKKLESTNHSSNGDNKDKNHTKRDIQEQVKID